MGSKKKYDIKKVAKTFFIESRELLEDMESSLLGIERGEYTDETINSIFRSAHTIKGSSGMFGFDDIGHFTHVTENLLDKIRTKEIAICPDLVALLLDCADHIIHLLDSVEASENGRAAGEILVHSEELIEKLNLYIGDSETGLIKPEKPEEIKTEIEKPVINSASVLNECWHISLRFSNDVFKHGLDPQSFIKYMETMGELKNIKVISEGIPPLDEMNAENCYIGLEIDFKGDVRKENIEENFEFMSDDCTLRILPPRSNINDYIKLLDELPEDVEKIGEILKQIGSLTDTELKEAIDMKMTRMVNELKGEPVKPIGEIIVENKMVQKEVLDAALEKQVKMKKTSTLRIDAEKLDNLINLVGELVISGATIKQISDEDTIERNNLNKSVAEMSRLIEDIRDSTMNIRMVPIGETFKRFERVVRDLSRDRDKEVDLVITGGETELDKTLTDMISDPLIHLIRNAVDHGIDMPQERINKGKPRRGKIHLNAFHEAGNIVIEVSDDGDGLNRDKIYTKALNAELIQPDQQISNQELYQFIFQAGFSTAEKVTSISGRGVGMDVVKRNIESLRGMVYINSEPGEGTLVRIQLPLTLAIIDGFMFQVGESPFVIPLNIVHECTETRKESLQSKDGSRIINLRGEALPYVSLRDFFKVEGNEPDLINVIIVEYKGAKTGLVVDSLAGELQTVIKPLGDIFQNIDWISGSTILGSGDVALILDVPKLIQNIHKIETDESSAA